MAASKLLSKSTLVIPCVIPQEGKNPRIQNKSFDNVKHDATVDNVLAVANAIVAVISVSTAPAELRETYRLVQG